MQRVTAVALVPLTLWFVVSLIAHLGAPRAAAVAWLGSPFVAIAMVLLLIATFYHMALGIEVVIEDYVHHDWREDRGAHAQPLAAWSLAAAGIFAVLRIALGS